MKKNILIVLLFFTAIISQAQNYVYERKFDNYTTQAPAANFNNPYAVTTASNGNFIVADYGSSYVYIISSTGILISEFGGNGSGDGQFINPMGVAVDGGGNIYVVDRGNHRIQKFTNTGVFISKWGTVGTGNGQFNSPSDIVLNGVYLYVTDLGNNRVQYFNLAGAYVGQFGSSGTGNGQFNTPSGIAADGSGNVYVSDRLNNRIQKFTSTGTYTTQWGTLGTGDGQFNTPQKIKSDGTSIYVVDQNNSRVQKFNTSGTFLLKWGTAGTADNQFTTPKAITFSAGNVVVLDANYFKFYTSAGVYVSKFTSKKNANGQFNSPQDVTVDPAGNIYVLDQANARVQRLAANGDYVSQYTYGLPNDVVSIAMDDNGVSIYHVRRTANEVYRSPAPGGPFGVDVESGAGSGVGQILSPVAVCVDNSGFIYVLEDGNRRVQKFNNGDFYVTKWGTSGTGDGQFNTPKSIAADNLGNIFVAEQSRIQKFSNTGTFILKWGSFGSANGQFTNIKDIATDAQGNVYVVDGTRVQKFDGNGTFITSFGTSGSGAGKFLSTTGIFVDATGRVYVSDATNNNVQTFVVDKEIKVTEGGDEFTSGSGVYDFGTVTLPGSSSDVTFTISNTGSLPLALTGSSAKVSLIGGNTSDFIINQTSVPASIAGGASATFTVHFTPSATGVRTTTMVIANDDSDENPYSITLTGTGKSDQTITSGGDITKIYGAVSFTPTSSASSGLNVSYSSANTAVATVSGNIITIVGAGTSLITVSQSGSSSFNAAPDQTFTLTVLKKNLTITADDKAREEGQANPVFTYTISGFVYSDNASVLTGAPSFSCNAGAGTAAGMYSIDVLPGSLAADNYNFIFQSGILTISTPTGVTSTNYAKTMALYPNPSNGTFTIEANDQIEKITVIDAAGRKETFLGQAQVNTSLKGLVILEVVTDKGTAYIKAIVK